MSKKRAHGEGTIDPRGDSAWRLRYRADGQRHAVTFHGSKTDAHKELRRLLKTADDGTHVDPSRVTVSEFFDRWERDWAATNVSPKRGSSPSRSNSISATRPFRSFARSISTSFMPSCYAKDCQPARSGTSTASCTACLAMPPHGTSSNRTSPHW
jgi:hypothetical protein